MEGSQPVTDAFKLQMFHAREEYAMLTSTPKCLPECRLVMKGEMYMAGVQYDAVDGTGMQAKLDCLGNMSESKYLKLIETKGFACVCKPGALLIVPAGFLVINLLPSAADSCEGIRWSFLRTGSMDGSSKDVAMTLAGMEALLADFGAGGDNSALEAVKLAIESLK